MAAGVVESWRALRELDEISVVDLTACLLRGCRRHLARLDAALQWRHLRRQRPDLYLREATALLARSDAFDPEFLQRSTIHAMLEFLEASPSDDDQLLRMRALATALDDAHGQLFFAWFAGRCMECRAGDPVPVQPADVIAEELGTTRGLTPPPDLVDVHYLDAPLDGTQMLRLCPDDLGRFTVVIDARYAGVVDALFANDRVAAPGPELTWAAVVPSCNILRDLDYDTHDDVAPPAFSRVRPRARMADAYRARLLRCLDLAADDGASIIVLPELCSDAGIEEAVTQWFAKRPTIAIVIAGSRHVAERDGLRNRARILLRGAAGSEHLSHDKFSSFSLDLQGTHRTELIERPNRLRVLMGRRWSFSVLICKDFLEPVPRRILTDLRVRAVLVASMSPKTDLFVTDAQAMAQDSQALVFVSNAPLGARDDVAIFGRPLRRQAAKIAEQADGLVATITTSGDKFQIVTIDQRNENAS